MQRVRHKGFTRACFAFDQHMTIGLTKVEDIFLQTLHHGGRADQLFHQRPAIAQLAAQFTVTQRQAPRNRGLFGQFGHAVGVERLFKKIERADAHRFNGHWHIAVARDHYNRKGAVDALELLEKLHPVHARHLDVADHETRVIGTNDSLARLPHWDRFRCRIQTTQATAKWTGACLVHHQRPRFSWLGP